MGGEATKGLLAAAAAELLDQGGQSAVTIRAVAERCNVSHNAPYKHFTGRSDLLAAVAERDFGELRRLFEQESLGEAINARAALNSALHQLAEYARAHEARYRLLFSDPDLSPNETLTAAAFGSFQAFRLLVSRYQFRLVQPAIDELQLAGLIYATTHGAIDLELSSRASDGKGLSRVETTITLLLDVLEGSA